MVLTANQKVAFEARCRIWDLEALCYALNTKENHEIICQSQWDTIAHTDLSYSVERNSVKFPQQESFMYKIFNREISTLLFKITIYFVKTKLLMFYSGIMSDTGACSNLRKTTISFVLSNCLSLTANTKTRIRLDGFC